MIPWVIPLWEGRDVLALRQAMRLSQRDFATHLGIQSRTIAKWDGRPTMRLRPAYQSLLDAALRLTDDETRSRFVMLRKKGRE